MVQSLALPTQTFDLFDDLRACLRPPVALVLDPRLCGPGPDMLGDEGALNLSDGTNDSERGLAHGRTGVDLLGDRYEVNAQMTEHFAGINQLLGGLGEAVKPPDQHGIDLPCAYGLPKFGELWPLTAAPHPSRL